MKRRTLIIAAAVTPLLTACGRAAQAKEKIVVYKSASCGCCGGWVEHMKDAGYDVEYHNVADLDAIKRKYNVPRAIETCHTSVVGDYVVEGHVPSKVVDGLLEKRPAVDLIGLPGMPPGSPGMPGRKDRTWTVYGVTNGKISIFEKV